VQIITLCTLHFAFVVVPVSDELSDREFMRCFVEVVDFIEEMEDSLQTHPTV
jgi:hypothetical protein